MGGFKGRHGRPKLWGGPSRRGLHARREAWPGEGHSRGESDRRGQKDWKSERGQRGPRPRPRPERGEAPWASKRRRDRGRFRGEKRDPGARKEPKEKRTGANSIPVNWKPPQAEEQPQGVTAKSAPPRKPSPVGPAGRGTPIPAWKTKQEGPALAALPAPDFSSTSRPSGAVPAPAGHGAHSSDRRGHPPPSIPSDPRREDRRRALGRVARRVSRSRSKRPYERQGESSRGWRRPDRKGASGKGREREGRRLAPEPRRSGHEEVREDPDLIECSLHQKLRRWDKIEEKERKWVCIASCPCIVWVGGEDLEPLRRALQSRGEEHLLEGFEVRPETAVPALHAPSSSLAGAERQAEPAPTREEDRLEQPQAAMSSIYTGSDVDNDEVAEEVLEHHEHVYLEDDRLHPFGPSPMGLENLVAFMASMDVTRKGVLRGAPAGRVLRNLWPILTRRVDNETAFQVSKSVVRIKEFWSHSWHGSTWRKVLTLLVVKNGLAALISSLFFALLFALLFGFGLLPAYGAGVETEDEGERVFSSVWALSAGLVSGCLTLIFWRPQSSIFLDRVCIDQRSSKAKAEGTLNIGAFLKNSEAMLVLWDSSYVERLWCIFELAAYLKSHEEAEVVLAVVPFDDQIVGSIVLTVLGTSGFYFAGGQFRNFYQEVGTMKAQMKEFRTHKAKAWCCSVNHLDEKGDPMLCDRVIVTKCISAWFGSEKQFEVVVQSKVMHSVLQRLEGMRAFPYLWLVGSFAPIAWGMMDAVAAQLRYGHFQPSMSFTINGANWWLCSMPCLFVFWMTLIQRCHKKSNAKWKEVLVNLAIMLAMSTLFLAFFGVTRAVSALVEDKVLGQVILLVLMAIVTALTFGSQCRRKPVVINPASSEK
ncbi:unnamed protein product [Effrenium voratum]|uniref:Uncharacterized protein n=1 Tax=Effrenium voratum TaxID=2562239 RepID=A0AA36JIY4_9DINO|nr:unnamed protein product [Effrenium voratum]